MFISSDDSLNFRHFSLFVGLYIVKITDNRYFDCMEFILKSKLIGQRNRVL